jgi:hypothetical protein
MKHFHTFPKCPKSTCKNAHGCSFARLTLGTRKLWCLLGTAMVPQDLHHLYKPMPFVNHHDI